MKKQINYPKIQQFRNVVSTIRRESSFVGLDADENPIYNDALQKPILTFKGTIKLHGTNAAVCYNEISGIWFQSRSRIITPESDNAGLGNLIRWIIKDINKEENDVMIKNGLYSKDVNKYIAPKVKGMFLKLL